MEGDIYGPRVEREPNSKALIDSSKALIVLNFLVQRLELCEQSYATLAVIKMG